MQSELAGHVSGCSLPSAYWISGFYHNSTKESRISNFDFFPFLVVLYRKKYHFIFSIGILNIMQLPIPAFDRIFNLLSVP